MAIAFVQEANTNSGGAGVGTGTSFSTLAANATVGNWLVLSVLPTHSGSTVTQVTGLGTWSQVVTGVTPGSYDIEWWACQVTSAAKAITVTTTLGNYFAYVGEFSGVGSVASGGTASVTGTNPSLGVAQSSGDAVLVASTNDSVHPTAGPSSPWSDYDTGDYSWTNYSDVVRQISSTTGTLTATWTAASDGYATLGIILAPSGGSVVNSGFFDLL
jgi:hypothetical protein